MIFPFARERILYRQSTEVYADEKPNHPVREDGANAEPINVATAQACRCPIAYGTTWSLPQITSERFGRRVPQRLSQSGRTPDVVEYVERARRSGAITVAITNDPSSDLARAAELILPLAAGPERAVAATKTYVNQLAALVLLAGHVLGDATAVSEGIHKTADLLDGAVRDVAEPAAAAALHFAYVERMFVIGRGIEYATAREVALKLTETCRVTAGPLTATDLAHGPIAAVDPRFPVWTIASRDETLRGTVEAAERARAAGALLIASGNAASDVVGATYSLPVPVAPLPLLAPLLSVVPGQLFASALAQAKGLDADSPAGLSKVTLAR